jgi:hypothetical protein
MLHSADTTPTNDPTVVIEDRGLGYVVYRGIRGDRWRMDGVCNCCGACEVGANTPRKQWLGPVGSPGACVDVRGMDRLDDPMRPEAAAKLPTCTLRGVYL